MGKLTEKALAAAATLPDDEQEAIGACLLAEIDSERRWDELFARPASLAIEQMEGEALRAHEGGLTEPLDPDAL